MSKGKNVSNWAVFGQAAWDTATDLTIKGEVRCEVVLWPSARRGVFIFEAVAKQTEARGVERSVCRVQAEFPNFRAETLEAFFYSLLTKLQHCVEARQADEAARAVMPGIRA
jgi:hypothetical protein